MTTRSEHPGARNMAAFTLLEVLLAVSILAAISVLIGAMWSQARGWTDESALSKRTMRLQRVCEMMRSQWADRRTSVAITKEGATGVTTPSSLEFSTATPILFPEWPLVIASYAIEREAGSPQGAQESFALRYTETKIARLDPADADEARAGESSSIVLLHGVKGLRWERFGAAELRVDGEEAPPADRTPGWRSYTANEKRMVPAVRLLGEVNKEPLACVFVIEALR